MKIAITLDVRSGEMDDDELSTEIDRINQLIADGFEQGDLYSEADGDRERIGYQGWWNLSKDELDEPSTAPLLAALKAVVGCPQAAPWLARLPMENGSGSVWDACLAAINAAEGRADG